MGMIFSYQNDKSYLSKLNTQRHSVELTFLLFFSSFLPENPILLIYILFPGFSQESCL